NGLALAVIELLVVRLGFHATPYWVWFQGCCTSGLRGPRAEGHFDTTNSAKSRQDNGLCMANGTGRRKPALHHLYSRFTELHPRK
ncbi:MAG: hypothetical protein ACYCZ6_16335, partial [Polaromonas sp.]